jgi:dihydroorotate dehydrogenase (NAD+) catalytic subunit
MLTTTFLNKRFFNPIVLASGILGVTAASMNNAIKNGCGGVTIKSLTLKPRVGHNNPTMVGSEHYFLNAVGFSNPGVEEGIKEIIKFKKVSDKPLIGSIFAANPNEFVKIAAKICEAPIDILEVDFSCPNVIKEFGEPLAYSLKTVEFITNKIRKTITKPITIKLSANAWNIADIAKASEAAGADAITAVNTISALTIDIKSKKPILHNKKGGMSGPALFPVALRCVYDIYKAVKIPIIGTGGITTGQDAIAMIMAGATLLGVGSAVYFRGEDVFKKITDEMIEFMKAEGIKSLEEIRGAAHN